MTTFGEVTDRKPTITLTFEFDAEYDEADDYTRYELAEIRSVSDGLPPGAVEGIQERGAQSVFYWVGVVNAILTAMDGKPVTREDIKW